MKFIMKLFELSIDIISTIISAFLLGLFTYLIVVAPGFLEITNDW